MRTLLQRKIPNSHPFSNVRTLSSKTTGWGQQEADFRATKERSRARKSFPCHTYRGGPVPVNDTI